MSEYQQGGSSDYASTFYAAGAVGGPAAVSRATLSGIDNAPMFNPLSAKAVIPTLPATGIVPSGLYFSSATGSATFQAGGAVAPKPLKLKLKTPSRPCKWRNLSCTNCTGNFRTCPKLNKLHKMVTA